jgi:hypothetical protein
MEEWNNGRMEMAQEWNNGRRKWRKNGMLEEWIS